MSCLDGRPAARVDGLGKGFWMAGIKTTVVGSYPVPTWLRVFSTRESLRDAMLAVIKTQELAGIDVVADGELYVTGRVKDIIIKGGRNLLGH